MRSHHVCLFCPECNAPQLGHGPTHAEAAIAAKKSLKECRRRHRLDDRAERTLANTPTYQMAQSILAVWEQEGIGA